MPLEIHLLDMGQTMYGDSILVTRGDRRILIDGGHPGDFASIAAQLGKLLGAEPPFHVNLLVVTHCHLDHIGCLPRLVAEGVLTAEWALVADERLGWGRTEAEPDAADAQLPSGQRKLVRALQEEPADDLADAELAEFLDAAATLEDKYTEMLAKLKADGTKVVRYGRDRMARVRATETEFADLGLKVLGPTKNHLVVCAESIRESSRRVHDTLPTGDVADEAGTLVEAYRAAVQAEARRGVELFEDAAVEDRAGVGAAKNDQSVVLSVEADGWRALLAADMQFAAAEVPELDDEMATLRAIVKDAGPYDFIKLSHHTSYNGFDETLLEEWQPTTLFAHTGGSNDAGHPARGVLDLLKANRQRLKFARTDRNGIITVKKVGNAVRMIPARGQLNNFSRNRPAPVTPAPDSSPPTDMPSVSTRVVAGTGECVEVTARIPHHDTRVTLTIQIESGGLSD